MKGLGRLIGLLAFLVILLLVLPSCGLEELAEMTDPVAILFACCPIP